MTPLEYNPIVDLFDKYVCNRFAGEICEFSYMDAVIEVQMDLLRLSDDEKVKWFLHTIADKHLKANLEMEYSKQYTRKKRACLN